MPYKTPNEIAQCIESVREHSHTAIADRLDVDRSAVSHTLGSPSSRRIRLLARIAELYDIEVDPDAPAYPVDEQGVKEEENET